MNSKELLDQLLKSQSKEDEDKRIFILQKADRMNTRWLESRDEPDFIAADKDFCTAIEKLPEALIMTIVETDEDTEFKRYCERHPTLWHDTLVKDDFHGEEVPALLPRKKCSTLDQFIGRFFLGRWMEQKEPDFLDKACDMHVFPALAARCQANIDALAAELASNKSDIKIKELEDKIIDDLNHLNNYYWAPGFIYSFYSFMQLAKLHHIDIQSQEDSAEVQTENRFLLNALECEQMAARLFKHPLSLSLLKDHGFEEKMKSFMDNNEFNEFEAAEKMVLERLHIDRTNSMYTSTIKKVEEKLSSSQTVIERAERRFKK